MSATLVLNTDTTPVSLLPLSIISWEESIRYLVLDKVSVLEWHENWIVRSANWQTRVPCVIMLKEYMKKKATVRFSKSNVFLRDQYLCQYCGIKVTRGTATLDHVLPISIGGKTNYENTVTACGTCNSRKGNNKKIVPKIKPYKPGYYQLVERRKQMGWDMVNPIWKPYLEY